MNFHDDTSSEEVTKLTAETIREAARIIGKADRVIHDADIQDLKSAMLELENILDFKLRINTNQS